MQIHNIVKTNQDTKLEIYAMAT